MTFQTAERLSARPALHKRAELRMTIKQLNLELSEGDSIIRDVNHVFDIPLFATTAQHHAAKSTIFSLLHCLDLNCG